MIKIDSATVRVMRSHDYSHFEVCLTSNTATDPEMVDNLRKEAARLVDKAVDQFKVMKENLSRLEVEERRRLYPTGHIRDIRSKKESDRTPEEMAVLKEYDDRCHRNRIRYNYENDWDEPDCQDQSW